MVDEVVAGTKVGGLPSFALSRRLSSELAFIERYWIRRKDHLLAPSFLFIRLYRKSPERRVLTWQRGPK